jgi:GNAT superfamily N-acetyltransferase
MMTTSRAFSIRQAISEDAAGILACLRGAFAPYQDSYTPDAYRDTVLTADTLRDRLGSMSVLVAATPAGDIVGTISSQVASHDEGHLRGMAVLPDWQGAGVAAHLLDAAERELRQQRCSRITLDTTEPLRRAIRFYERHGYAASGRVTDFFGMPVYEYVKVLSAVSGLPGRSEAGR